MGNQIESRIKLYCSFQWYKKLGVTILHKLTLNTYVTHIGTYRHTHRNIDISALYGIRMSWSSVDNGGCLGKYTLGFFHDGHVKMLSHCYVWNDLPINLPPGRLSTALPGLTSSSHFCSV